VPTPAPAPGPAHVPAPVPEPVPTPASAPVPRRSTVARPITAHAHDELISLLTPEQVRN
jgi:hypothetical protein